MGYVNDPNGPIWHRGRLHMFFQYRPTVLPGATGIMWGHCSSPDLVNWEIHATALAPSKEHPGPDGFWSGNTVEHEGRLVAFYSAQRKSDRYQLPTMTNSQDGGYSFQGDWPTIPRPGESEGVEVLRDPFVWHQDGRWRMLVGSGLVDGTAQVLLYESEDSPVLGKPGRIRRAKRMAGR